MTADVMMYIIILMLIIIPDALRLTNNAQMLIICQILILIGFDYNFTVT